MSEQEQPEWEMPGFPEPRVSGTTDEGRVRYLKTFVPPDHLEGMNMFVRHYGGWQLGVRAQNVLLLALLEGWAQALGYINDITPVEAADGETISEASEAIEEADGEGNTEQLGGSAQSGVEGGEEGTVAGVEDSGLREGS